MRLGLHQPYFFPYLPYYQLVFAVDRFIAYDDVQWIKGGWINRNLYLVGGRPTFFRVPTRGASSNVSLRDVAVFDGPWREKMLRSFEQQYARAPYRGEGLALLQKVLSDRSPFVADLAIGSLNIVRDYLGYRTHICRSSNRYPAVVARGQERVISICCAEGASEYVNAIGGMTLYDSAAFHRSGISLRFLKCAVPVSPNQPRHLSILDLLMHYSVDEVRQRLSVYELS